MMTWKDRIEQIKATFGIKNNRQLEQILGLSNGYINDLIGEKKNKNPSKIIVSLRKTYSISPAWFYDESVGMFGEKSENTIRRESDLILAVRKAENDTKDRLLDIEKRLYRLEMKMGLDIMVENIPEFSDEPDLKTPASNEAPSYTAEPAPGYGEEEEEYEEIPYVWDIAAGPPIDIDEDRGEAAAVLKRRLKKGERYYAASIRGGSMAEAGIRDGDMVLIRYADVPKDGFIQVVRYKDQSTLKRLRKTGKGWELHYEDGSGRVITGDSADYEVQGEFIAVLPVTANLRDK
jgi:SOS-response transcriptional repressor LexA